MEDQDIEVPEYFVCPISLQIMKDPVTVVTGITYDRECIERWLTNTPNATTCPVTRQLLHRGSNLTPNHTLLRLIQSWCISNGIDTIPTPKTPLDRNLVLGLVRDLEIDGLFVNTLKRLEKLVTLNERNRQFLVDVGVAEALVSSVVKCVNKEKVIGLEESLRILNAVSNLRGPELKRLFQRNYEFIDALTSILGFNTGENGTVIKSEALMLLKKVTEVANLGLLERLKLEFFENVVNVLSSIKNSQRDVKLALRVLIDTCPWGRNRAKIIWAGAVFELIEIELERPDTRVTELIFDLLGQLCSSEEGRNQLLCHAGGIAVVSKRTLRVSAAVDDRAVQILSMISKHSATDEVLEEMLRVGVVSKLCMVLRMECAARLKREARSVLELHSNVWNKSPCIQVYLLTRHAA